MTKDLNKFIDEVFEDLYEVLDSNSSKDIAKCDIEEELKWKSRELMFIRFRSIYSLPFDCLENADDLEEFNRIERLYFDFGGLYSFVRSLDYNKDELEGFMNTIMDDIHYLYQRTYAYVMYLREELEVKLDEAMQEQDM